jgi:hypothetical protein
MRKLRGNIILFTAAEHIGYQERAQRYAADTPAQPGKKAAAIYIQCMLKDLIFHLHMF